MDWVLLARTVAALGSRSAEPSPLALGTESSDERVTEVPQLRSHPGSVV
jgi:hypothetical protein